MTEMTLAQIIFMARSLRRTETPLEPFFDAYDIPLATREKVIDLITPKTGVLRREPPKEDAR